MPARPVTSQAGLALALEAAYNDTNYHRYKRAGGLLFVYHHIYPQSRYRPTSQDPFSVKPAFPSERSKRKAHYFGWSINMPDISEPSFEGRYKSAKTILIVEDDPFIGEFFVQAITEENRHVALLVTSGFEALEVIKEVTPDLFLLDYHLPHMNGIELYDRLHATKGLERVPTIMTSAGVLEHDFQNRHIVGISKPVELNKLLDLIEELLA